MGAMLMCISCAIRPLAAAARYVRAAVMLEVRAGGLWPCRSRVRQDIAEHCSGHFSRVTLTLGPDST